MNISKFTQKSIQAVQDLEKVAYEFGNQEVEQEHLLYALLHQDDSLIAKLIVKMEINGDAFGPLVLVELHHVHIRLDEDDTDRLAGLVL